MYEGTDFTISIRTLTGEVTKCRVETPQNNTFKFTPRDEAASTEKFLILQGTESRRCSVAIRNLDENDEGEWLISYTNVEGTGSVETFNISVKPLKTPSDPVPDDEGKLIKLITNRHILRIE